MRLNNYLVEKHIIKTLSAEEFHTAINKYCSKSLNSYFFRGEHSREQFIYVEPSKGRKSPYTFGNNIYNLLLSNLPSWSKYPKRENSLVCTSDLKRAELYNDSVYKVYPLNGKKLGVCPERDIWFSFDKILNGDTLDDLNQYIIFLSQLCYPNDDDSFDTYGELVNGFKFIDKKFEEDGFSKIFDKIFERNNYVFTFLHKIGYDKPGAKLINCLNKYMSPEYNNFSLVNTGKKIYGKHEVWMDSPCYLEMVR